MIQITQLWLPWSPDIQPPCLLHRYRTLCDDAAQAARAGIYTVHDQELLETKATTIVNCFIDSELPPKVQVEIRVDTGNFMEIPLKAFRYECTGYKFKMLQSGITSSAICQL